MLNYRPEIDGLRAVAVIPVLLFHFNLGCRGGFAGVDVFFVISGFLITSLVNSAARDDRFSMLDFWRRRLLRIAPALLIMLLVVLTCSLWLQLPIYRSSTAMLALSNLAMLSNVKLYLQTDYWSPATNAMPLLHTWSLAVEEQFYLAVPFLSPLLRRSTAYIVVVIVALTFAGSLAASVLLSDRYPTFAFYLLPCRAWELCAGSLVAIFGSRIAPRSTWAQNGASFVGLAAVIFSYFYLSPVTTFPGIAAVLPVTGAAIFILANQHNSTIAGRFLALKPIVYTGKISYSLYLWHWPLVVFAPAFVESSRTTSLGILVVSYLLATVSYLYIEQPFRLHSKNGGLRPRIAIILLGATAVVCMAIMFRVFGGFPQRLPGEFRHFHEQLAHSTMPNYDASSSIDTGGLCFGSDPRGSSPEVVVIGSSHAMMYGDVLKEVCGKFRIPVSFLTARGTHGRFESPTESTHAGLFDTPQGKLQFDAKRKGFLAKWHPRLVVWIDRWDQYEPLASESARESLKQTYQFLSEHADNVLILGQPPVAAEEIDGAFAVWFWNRYLRKGRVDVDNVLTERRAAGSRRKEVERFNFLLAESYSFRFVPVADYFKDGETLKVVKGGQLMYHDGDHLTSEGALLLKAVFESVIQKSTGDITSD